MCANPNLIYYDWFVFCSIPRLFVCLRMRLSTSKQYANVYVNQYSRSEVHCGRAVRFGQALPGFFITAPPSVCVSAELGALAVWIRTQKKRWNKPKVIGADSNPTKKSKKNYVGSSNPKKEKKKGTRVMQTCILHYYLSQVIRLGLRNPKKKER